MSGNGDKYMTISSSMSGFAALGMLLFGLFALCFCTWPNVGWGPDVPLTLPEATHASILPSEETGVDVSIQADAKIWVDHRWVSPERTVEALREHRENEAVFLWVDRRVPFSKVRPILRSIQSAGIRKVYLVTLWPQIGLYPYLFRHSRPAPNL